MPNALSIRYGKLQTSVCRRICAWCTSDLGELTYHSEHPSYGICADCAHQYFADLYTAEEHAMAPPTLRERAVGAD
jgi:hypothetical protein